MTNRRYWRHLFLQTTKSGVNSATANTSRSHQHGLEIRPGMFTINGRMKRIVGTIQSIGTFFRVYRCALWCTRLGSTSRTYIKYVTVAMRDIDSGRPNIALLTELDNAVSKVLKRHFFSENVNSYALICMFTNRKLLIGTIPIKYVMHQLVSMNLYVLQKHTIWYLRMDIR